MSTTLPAVTLAEYDDDTIARWYNASDGDEWHAQLVAEMQRRDDVQRAPARAPRRDDPERAEWHGAAYAQYLRAEAACSGYLVRKPHHDYDEDQRSPGKCAECGHLSGYLRHRGVDAFALWSGSDEQAHALATDELREFWEHDPRLTMTEYRRQAAASRREDREARSDRVDANAAGALRSVASEREGSARARADSRGVTVPGSAASRGAQDSQAGRAAARSGGTVRGGRVSETTSRTEELRRRAAMARERLAAVSGDTVAGEQEPGEVNVPGSAERVLTGTVALRPPGTPATQARTRIDGETVLGYVRAYLSEYAAFPSQASLDAVSLWAAHTHVRDGDGRLAWRATPRLLLMSSEPGSGKSRVLELLARLCPFTYGLDTEPTAAGLAHTLDKEHATVLIDEGDILFGAGKRKESVRAVINSGYTAKGTVLRMRGSKAERAHVFGPLAIAGLDVLEKATGTALDATLDRCVIVRMRKASCQLPDVAARADRAGELLTAALSAWAQQNLDGVTDTEPGMPEGVHGRVAQIWQPLVALADAVGGEWPANAREACEELAVRGGVSDEMQMDAMDELAVMFSGAADEEWLPGEDDFS